MSKSVTMPEDLRHSALLELIRIAETGPHTVKTSTGAGDRNYLLAIGFLEKDGDAYKLSHEGRAFVFDHALSDKVMMA